VFRRKYILQTKEKLHFDGYINMGHIMLIFGIQKTALYLGSGSIGVKNWTFIQTEAGLIHGRIEMQNYLNTD
jgi:hypothetical protein